MSLTTAIRLMLQLVALTLGYYLSYLILIKIQATELMWFIWVIVIPFAVCGAVIGVNAENQRIDEAVEKRLKKRLL